MNYRLVPRLSLSYLAATLATLTANPIDPTPTVVTGDVQFSGLDTHSAVITQGSQQAIVDYSHFNIPEGSSVQFIQPNSQSALLNRITGADPSTLNGSLTANGQIYFVNPAGVTFGANSIIRADVFMAAAGQISNEDFLNNVQSFSLSGDITNHGSIQTENGVALLGQQVLNTGEIVARNGYAIVASGDRVLVRQGGTGLAVDVTDAAKASKSGTGVKNLGTVDGEEVMFSAGDAFATAIQQSGQVKAGKSAKIQSDGGHVEVSGEITARNDAGKGGRIEVGGTDMGADTAPSASSTTIAESAVLDASSDSGKGGHIVVWSDGHTEFAGTADARSRAGEGGFIEASGKTINLESIVDSILLDAGGHFLLDPEDILIDSTVADDIESMLDSGASMTFATQDGLAGNGDITVTANINVGINNALKKGTLTLDADRDIVVAEGVTIQNLQEDFSRGDVVFDFKAGRDIIFNGGLSHSDGGSTTGQGSIILDAGNRLLVNNTSLDANGGDLIITARELEIASGLEGTGSLVAGLLGDLGGKIDITATDLVRFSGGVIQTFGGTDVFIDTARLVNGTASDTFFPNNDTESFFAIRLPNPIDNGPGGGGSGDAHTYGGLQSQTQALFNVDNFDLVKTRALTEDRYYFSHQPEVRITAVNAQKDYGKTIALPVGAPAVMVNTSDFVSAAGLPFVQDTTGSAFDLTNVVTASNGAPAGANATDYPIVPSGAVSNNGYLINYVNGTLTVDPRAVTLTASQQNKQYGDILDFENTAFTISGLGGANDSTLPNLNMIDSVTLNSFEGIAGSETANAGTYQDEIRITGQSGSMGFDPNNYDITYVPGPLVVDRRNVTVTAEPQAKFFGDELVLTTPESTTAFRITDNGLTDGGDMDLPNTDAITSVTLLSVLPDDVAESPTAPVGVYENELRITGVSGEGGFDINNYNLSFVNGPLTVNRRPITLVPDNQSKEYGEELILGTTAFTVVDNGNDPVGPTGLPNNELIETVPLFSNLGYAGSTDQDVMVYDENIRIDPNAFTSANGTGGFNANNYEITFGRGTLTIDRRQIELVAGRQEKFYGDPLDLDDSTFSIIDQMNPLDSVLPNGELPVDVIVSSASGVDQSTMSDAGLYSNEIVIGSAVTGIDGFKESNYDITFTSGNLLVKPRPISVIPSEQSKTYGDTLTLANDKGVFTVVDLDGDNLLPNGEVVETVNLISRGMHDASTTSNAVTYSGDLEITSFGTGSNNFNPDNYTFDFTNFGDFVINRRAAQIIANPQRKDYGDIHDLGNTAFTVRDQGVEGAALPNNEVIETVTLVSANGIDASTDADAATYAGNISVTPTSTATPTLTGTANFNQENYTFSYETGTFTVDPRAITLTASTQEKIYGDPLTLDDTKFTTLDKTGVTTLPNGEVVTNVTINSATGVDASTTTDALTYTDEIEISGPVVGTAGSGDGFNEANYQIEYIPGDLVVNKRAITITPLQQEKTYGDTLTLANDKGVFTVVDLDGDNLLPNGEVVETVNLISRGMHDASTTSNAVTYSGDLEITSFGTGSNNFNPDNYTFDFTNFGDFVINRRAAQIIANPQRKDYGDIHDLGNTAFTVRDQGVEGAALPNNEVIETVTLVSANGIDASTDADAATYAGNISVTPTSTATPTLTGTANFNQENYTFSYETGTFTVDPRAITLTASTQEKIYGDPLTLDDTKFTTLDKTGVTTLPNGEVVTNVTINSATGVDASTTTDALTYTDEIEISGPVVGTAGSGDGFNEANYQIEYIPGDLVVNKRAITITPSQQEKTYGDTLTLANDKGVFTVVDLDGDNLLPNGEVVETVNLISRGMHDASTTSNAVTYSGDLEITSFGTGSNNFNPDNYTFDFTNFGDFVINRRAAQIIANPQRKDYGDIHDLGNTAFTVRDQGVEGAALPNNEVIETVTLVSANGIDASTDADAATYAGNISVTPTSTATPTLTGTANFNQENYTFSYETGTFTVDPRAITLTASTQEKIYGDPLTLDDTKFTTLDKTGVTTLPNGEVVTNVTINSATGVDASTTTDALTYTDEIEISGPLVGTAGSGDGFNEANYQIEYIPGDLVVNKRAITVTALPQGKTYGESVTPSTTGFSVLDLDGDSSLPNDESINSITITSSVAGDSVANVGLYTDDLAPTNILTSSAGFDEGNYNITRVNGNYTIEQRAILLTAQQQGKIYGDSEILADDAFTIADTFGNGGSTLPNGETIDTVTYVTTTVPGDTAASVGLYTDEINIADQVGSNGFLASNYDISYAPGNYDIARRAVELVIAGDTRFAGAGYTIDPAAFTTIDLDGDAFLPNGESIDTLNIVSVTGVAENPGSAMGLYVNELDADFASAIGSNGFSLSNYDLTVTPGNFKIDPYPGLPSLSQDVYLEQWIRDNVGIDPVDPFNQSYAISQSVGLRLISLNSWASLSSAKKKSVLVALDAIPLHLQTLEYARQLIEEIK